MRSKTDLKALSNRNKSKSQLTGLGESYGPGSKTDRKGAPMYYFQKFNPHKSTEEDQHHLTTTGSDDDGAGPVVAYLNNTNAIDNLKKFFVYRQHYEKY